MREAAHELSRFVEELVLADAARLLRGPRRRRGTRTRRRSRSPSAGSRASCTRTSTRTTRRPRRSSRRPPRPTRCSATPSAARPTTPTATTACKSGGYSPNMDFGGSICDLFSAFFGQGGFDAAFGGTRMRGGAVQGGDVALAVQIDARRGRARARRSRSPTTRPCCARPATATAPSRARRSSPATSCRGAGQIQQVQRTRFGQMVRTALCDKCGGDGRIAEQPCHTCDGRGMVGRASAT